MTHDKVRQDFEVQDEPFIGWSDTDMELSYTNGYQAGRAAERAEIREKLESEVMIGEICKAVYAASPAYIYGTTIVVPWDEVARYYREDAIREAKAAITKILEVI